MPQEELERPQDVAQVFRDQQLPRIPHPQEGQRAGIAARAGGLPEAPPERREDRQHGVTEVRGEPRLFACGQFGLTLTYRYQRGALGIALTFPVASAFGAAMGSLFPIFYVSTSTVLLQAACALAVGLIAALLPGRRAARLNIVEGLRSVG